MRYDWIKELSKINMTFSKHCHSGIAKYVSADHKCGCCRCRQSRGENANDETELQAELDSVLAQARFRNHLFGGGPPPPEKASGEE